MKDHVDLVKNLLKQFGRMRKASLQLGVPYKILHRYDRYYHCVMQQGNEADVFLQHATIAKRKVKGGGNA